MHALALFLALIVGPEQPVTTPGPLSVPVADSLAMTGASDGDSALLVWISLNHDVTEIAGRRVSANGDPLGAPIVFSGAGDHFAVAIGWTGSRYILAWWREDVIEARTVERDGTLGPVNTIQHEHGEWGVRLSMACASERCLLAWSREDLYREKSFVSAAMVGRDALLAAGPTLVSSDLSGDEIATSAADGSFLLVENNNTSGYPYAPELLSATMFDANGTIVRQIQVPANGKGSRYLSAVCAGDGFVVGFEDDQANLMRIGFDGSVGPIHPIKNADWPVLAKTLWNGHVVAELDLNGSSRTVLLDLDGNVLRSGDRVSGIVVVGNQPALGLSPYSVRRVNLDLTLSDVVPLTLAPTDQYLPAIAAANVDQAMLIWAEPGRLTTGGLMSARLEDGVPQGGVSTVFSALRETSYAPFSIASNGSSYLAVWTDDRTETPTGRLFTAAGSINISPPGHTSAAVGWDGDSYVVAYTIGDYIAYKSVPHPEIMRVDENGHVLSIGDSGGTGSGYEMRIQCGRQACINVSDDSLALVTRYASAPLGLGTFPIDPSIPTVASAPVNFGFIVVENTASGIQWFHVNPNGVKSAVHDPLPSDVLGGIAATPFGNGVLIAWTTPPPRHIAGVIVAEDGKLTEGPFAMTASDDEESLPDLTNGRIAYVRSTDRYGIPRMGRVMTRSIAMPRHRAAGH